MSAAAKSLVLRGQDNIEVAKRFLDDPSQHMTVGYNLAQATELFLKALCVLREVELPTNEEQHDLDALMTLLEEDNLSAISSHADVVELTPYNSTRARVEEDERLDLREYLGHVEDLKRFVGEAL